MFTFNTAKEKADGLDIVPMNTIIRIIILDNLVPLGFMTLCLIFSKKSIASTFSTFTIIVYAYIGILALSTLLHIIMVAADDVIGQYKIEIAAAFSLTECFNTFLVLNYLSTAKRLINNYTIEELDKVPEETFSALK